MPREVLRAKPIPKGMTEVMYVLVGSGVGRDAFFFDFTPVPVALSGGTLVVELDTEKGEARLVLVTKREKCNDPRPGHEG